VKFVCYVVLGEARGWFGIRCVLGNVYSVLVGMAWALSCVCEEFVVVCMMAVCNVLFRFRFGLSPVFCVDRVVGRCLVVAKLSSLWVCKGSVLSVVL
jgi:hypothetical protein